MASAPLMVIDIYINRKGNYFQFTSRKTSLFEENMFQNTFPSVFRLVSDFALRKINSVNEDFLLCCSGVDAGYVVMSLTSRNLPSRE